MYRLSFRSFPAGTSDVISRAPIALVHPHTLASSVNSCAFGSFSNHSCVALSPLAKTSSGMELITLRVFSISSALPFNFGSRFSAAAFCSALAEVGAVVVAVLSAAAAGLVNEIGSTTASIAARILFFMLLELLIKKNEYMTYALHLLQACHKSIFTTFFTSIWLPPVFVDH